MNFTHAVNDTQAAEFLGVKPQTLRAWRSRNTVHIPFFRIGRAVRYRISDLQAYVDKQMVTGGIRTSGYDQ